MAFTGFEIEDEFYDEVNSKNLEYLKQMEINHDPVDWQVVDCWKQLVERFEYQRKEKQRAWAEWEIEWKKNMN